MIERDRTPLDLNTAPILHIAPPEVAIDSPPAIDQTNEQGETGAEIVWLKEGTDTAVVPPQNGSLAKRRIEADLFTQYKLDPTKLELRDRLFESYLPLAQHIALKFVSRGARFGIAFDDLMQVAGIGILKALERYNPTLGNAFSTFATPTITGEIQRFFRDHGYMIRVDRTTNEWAATIARLTEQFQRQAGRAPSDEELATLAELTEEELRMVTLAKDHTSFPLSLDQQKHENNSATLLSELLIDGIDIEMQVIERFDLVQLVQSRLALLKPKERQALFHRIFEGKTQSEIGALIGVSQMQVSRLLRRARAQLKLPDLFPREVERGTIPPQQKLRPYKRPTALVQEPTKKRRPSKIERSTSTTLRMSPSTPRLYPETPSTTEALLTDLGQEPQPEANEIIHPAENRTNEFSIEQVKLPARPLAKRISPNVVILSDSLLVALGREGIDRLRLREIALLSEEASLSLGDIVDLAYTTPPRQLRQRLETKLREPQFQLSPQGASKKAQALLNGLQADGALTARLWGNRKRLAALIPELAERHNIWMKLLGMPETYHISDDEIADYLREQIETL